MTERSTTASKFFPRFMTLNEDIQLNILSFISDTPFATTDTTYTNNINENQLIDLCESPLTHVLPLVSQHFRTLLQLVEADYLWKESLIRRIQNEPFIWKEGILSMIAKWDNNAATSSTLEDVDDAERILNVASGSYRKFQGVTNDSVVKDIHQLLFRNIVSGYIRCEGPVFIMEGDAHLNQLLGLHLFEPRYRLLIREVMSKSPQEHMMGNPIPGPNYPTFIYANHSSISPSTPAVLVQVKQCSIYQSGEADVFLMPIAHVWIEREWERPKSGGLHMARAIRMPKKASLNMGETALAAYYTMTRERREAGEDYSIQQILSEVYQHNQLQQG